MPLQTQQRQYRKKLKDAAKSERTRGNDIGAKFLERITSETGLIKWEHLKDIQLMQLSRYKQRANAIKKYVLAHNKLCQYPPNANSTVVQ
ncbi:hypothetical protein [Vibrio anguillarum]|uniref:hypothetical protein n=1 Tax=Vibrio anguillarum TaxID=55601 RepID=UPI0009805392|nr:hypothetical protein [Vibrio anguillarum]AQP35725.1 hypothetical protein AA909_04980 [Vibrio anguillarum]